MDRDRAKQAILSGIKCTDYLERSKSGLYCCPFCGSGHGPNGTGAVKYYPETNTICCFGSCSDGTQTGKKYDVLDLIQKVYGTDFNGAMKLAAAELNITIDHYRDAAADFAPENAQKRHKRPLKETDDKGQAEAEKAPNPANLSDYRQYYAECCQRLSDPAAISYLQARGITPATAAALGAGYDPEADPASAPGAASGERKPHPEKRLIFPCTQDFYIARSINPDTPGAFKAPNPKGSNTQLFNAAALYSGAPVVFVVEGVFDCLSFIEVGEAAIATNSKGNGKLLIDQLTQRPTKAKIVICHDNDTGDTREKTLKQAQELNSHLLSIGVNSIVYNIAGNYHDANDALVKDRAAFEQAIAAAKAQPPEPLPGLLTYNEAVNIFETADDSYIEFPSFLNFSKTAKIRTHDSIVLAADTGAGKSSLAINFLNDLNDAYPCIYINLEMDTIDVLRRLTAIHSGLLLDRIEGYNQDEQTAQRVNITLKKLTERKPLQVIQGAYLLNEIEDIIKRSVAGREEPTIVFIDHSLLVDIQAGSSGRYERFTQVSEGLRKIALTYNVILFVLLQQNRAGKYSEDERPKNSSLKESGSWENDATQICFLWYDTVDRQKKLLLTKNRHGEAGEFGLSYFSRTQVYMEDAETRNGQQQAKAAPHKPTKRERQQEKLSRAFEDAYIATGGRPTIRAMAEAADVTTSTIKTWIREYGGCTVDGVQKDPAGIDETVEYTGFVKLTPADNNPFEETEPEPERKERI